MSSPDVLSSLSPTLSEKLKQKTVEVWSKIIRDNYHTQFAQTATELAGFRNETVGLIDGMDNDTLSESFRKAVPLTTYESYAPFIARLLENPCKASAVIDLLAPGLPDYIINSSSTSGGRPKCFPKYNYFVSSGPDPHASFDPARKRTTAHVLFLLWSPVHIEDDNAHPVKTVYSTAVSVAQMRTLFSLHPEEDKERMGSFVLDHAAPFAAAFVKGMRSYLLIHVLFALCSKTLETMTISYTSMFVDMMRHLDAEFDVVVDCISSGSIPDWDGIAAIRPYLEMNMFPDPERASELRSLGPPSSQEAWCSRAWPNLRCITITASGSFATHLPLVQWYIGPGISTRPRGYGASEGRVGRPYNSADMNQYKIYSDQFRPNSEGVIEFLDVSEDDSINALSQIWEVKPGKQYEVVLTTPDGLWRYRLGDVVEIIGFDPTDGVPVIGFIERRNVVIRFLYFMLTEKELRAAAARMTLNTTVQMVGWTTIIDHRCTPTTIGFFVELAGDQGSDLTHLRDNVFDELSRLNGTIVEATSGGFFCKPTIRLVSYGTFSRFLQLKVEENGSQNLGQLKVPVVLSKEFHMTWFSNQVEREL